MHVSSKMQTMFGLCRTPECPPMLTVTLTAAELRSLAASLFRDAEAAELEGRYRTAKSIAWRAAALREAAR